MNRLIDEGSPTFHGPTALNGPGVVIGGAPPLDVAVALEKFAQTSVLDGFVDELAGIVETMLACAGCILEDWP